MEMIPKATVYELVAERDKALSLYSETRQVLLQARKAHEAALNGGKMGSAGSYNMRKVLEQYLVDGYARSDEDYDKQIRIALDREMWRSLVVNTPIFSLMDTEERKKFEESLEKEPPPATIENILATIQNLAGQSDMIFRRGLINAFKNLDRNFKSHDGFKLGSRMIMSYIQDNNGFFSRYAEDRLRDIDRVMHILDGKPEPSYGSGLVGTLKTAMDKARSESKVWAASAGKCETDYFVVRFFKKGHAHLWFKRDDLVTKANKMIAEYYGATVGAAPDVANKKPDPFKTHENLKEDFFPTPEELADEVIEAADIQPGNIVLEPSFGEGALIKAILRRTNNFDTIVGYEIDAERCNKAKTAIERAEISLSNFNFMDVNDAPAFDRIIMNPPFSNGQAQRHLLKALCNLGEHGRLVAIMPQNFVNGSLESKEIAAHFAQGEVTIKKIPAGAFKESGTMIPTVLVTFTKNS